MSKILSDVQYYDKYSRFDYSKGRRESWDETIRRVTDYLFSFDVRGVVPQDVRDKIHNAIIKKNVMPAMRLLSMAGPAAARNNICSYNCSAMGIDDLYRFYEAVIVLMNGAGLGISVEDRFVSKLPHVKEPSNNTNPVKFTVPDDTRGWAEVVLFAITHWMNGQSVEIDYSEIRPEGSPLRTKGGRAAGSESLKTSLEKIREIIESRRGMKLRSLDVHDIMCHIAKCIVSGGVRRAALLSLFDFDDSEMLSCKSAENIVGNEHRYLANNSAVVEKRMTYEELDGFMEKTFDSRAGEPGIFSRYAVKHSLPTRRTYDPNFIPNPCAEIILRSRSVCNLSSVIPRPTDSREAILEKVELATIIGTIQSMADYFPGLSSRWAENQEDERLLGVDLNNLMNVPTILDGPFLRELKELAVDTNRKWAKKLGIKAATGVTCVKPSGNTSVLLSTSPGIHALWSEYYIRRIQLHKDNPVLTVLREAGVPTEPSNHLDNTFVASFPEKAPTGAITNGTLSALEQLDVWKLVKTEWAEHSVSCTISYREWERDDIVKWLYENQEVIVGLSFLPKSDTIYEQSPYEKITKDRYEVLMREMPDEIDWSRLYELEENLGDVTNASQTAACDSDKCLISF